MSEPRRAELAPGRPAPPGGRLAVALGLPATPWIAGHRGAAAAALENTLPSFRLALAQGAHLVEMDVQLAADGELVVFHDEDLRRLGEFSGRIEEMASGALVGRPLADPRRGLAGQLPSLAQVLAALPAEAPLNLELKRVASDPSRFADRLAARLEGRRRILVSSFDHDLLARVAAALPDLPLAPLGRRRPRRLLTAARRLAAAAVHCHRRLARRRLVRLAAGSGRPVLAYTVNGALAARLLFWRGVAGIFTDRPGWMRERLGI